eukprot:jgi/Mesvir1/13080/Mv26291-RA.1
MATNLMLDCLSLRALFSICGLRVRRQRRPVRLLRWRARHGPLWLLVRCDPLWHQGHLRRCRLPPLLRPLLRSLPLRPRGLWLWLFGPPFRILALPALPIPSGSCPRVIGTGPLLWCMRRRSRATRPCLDVVCPHSPAASVTCRAPPPSLPSRPCPTGSPRCVGRLGIVAYPLRLIGLLSTWLF